MNAAVKRAGISGTAGIVCATISVIVSVFAWLDNRYASQEDVDHASATIDRIDGKLDKLTTMLIRPPGAPPNEPTPGEKADEAEEKLDALIRKIECERQKGGCPPEPERTEEPRP